MRFLEFLAANIHNPQYTTGLLRQLTLQPDYRRLGSGFRIISYCGSSLVKIDLSSS